MAHKWHTKTQRLPNITIATTEITAKGVRASAPGLKRFSVAFGEYYHPIQSGGHAKARGVFLKALLQTAPEVLEALRDDVLPVYMAFCTSTNRLPKTNRPPRLLKEGRTGTAKRIKGRYYAYFSDEVYWTDLQKFRHPVSIRLKTALNQWATRFNLNEEWIKDAALTTLWHWKFNPSSPSMIWKLIHVYMHATTAKERLVKFQKAGWEPAEESWPEARKRLITEFEQYLEKDYRPNLESLTIKGGFVKSHPKKTPKHFEWLVRYQVQKWSHARITYKYDVDRKSVKEALDSTAKLVGIALRKPKKGGRPPKPGSPPPK